MKTRDFLRELVADWNPLQLAIASAVLSGGVLGWACFPALCGMRGWTAVAAGTALSAAYCAGLWAVLGMTPVQRWVDTGRWRNR